MTETRATRSSRDGRELPFASELARTLLVVTFAVASTLLGILQIGAESDWTQFFNANQIALAVRRTHLAQGWGLGFLAAIAACVAAVTRSRGDADRGERLRRYRVLIAPFILTSFAPLLFSERAWDNREAAYLAYALAFGLALERLAWPAFEEARHVLPTRVHDIVRQGTAHPAWRRAQRILPVIVALTLVGFYIYRVGRLTNVSHFKLMTASSDLAEYDNMFFNALSGHPFRSPAIAGHLEDWSTLQGHAEFGLYLLLPLYALSPGAPALLWIQTSLVALTAIPLFLLASARLGQWVGLCVATAFLFMPAVQQPNFYDFHFTPLSMFFVAWLLYGSYRLYQNPAKRKWRLLVYASLGFALLCREDVGMGTGVLGAFLVLSGALVRDGFIIGSISSVYFLGMKFGIMPLFGEWWFDDMYQQLKAQGAEGFTAILLTLLSNPSFTLRTMLWEPKLLYMLHMIAPMLALWMRRPLLWLALLPGFVATLLVTERPPMFQASFQYTYLWLPYVVAASVLAIRQGLRGKATALALLLVGASLTTQLGVFPTGERIKGGFGTKTFQISERERKQHRQLQAAIEEIPDDAVLAATEAVGPHVSNRPVMYSLKYTLGDSPEYLLVGRVSHRAEPDNIRKALESGEYGVIARHGRFIVAKRGASTDKNDILWRRVGGRQRKPR